MREERPAPGVLPYEINSELWSDGATAERFLAVPGTGKIGLDGQGTWQFPEGSVLARTVSLELEPGKPASRRRLETQVLHLETGAWRPYSYVWNDDQDDALLAGADGALATRSTVGNGRRQRRADVSGPCPVGVRPLPQSLGREEDDGLRHPVGLAAGGQYSPDEQAVRAVRGQGQPAHGAVMTTGCWRGRRIRRSCRAWSIHTTSRPISIVARGPTSKRIARTATSSMPAARRTSRWDSRFRSRRRKTVGIRPIQGTFGISGARIIAPGDPAGSVLYYRMSKLGGGRMPRAGSNQVDERATRMIHDWIAGCPGPTDQAERGREAARRGSRGDRGAAYAAIASRRSAVGRRSAGWPRRPAAPVAAGLDRSRRRLRST